MRRLAEVDLVLASTSPYRRELLDRLGAPARQQAPYVDESPLTDEPPADLARRLARAKAMAVAVGNPGALVIGSDQVAESAGQILGKPGSFDKALGQLQASSGRVVTFYTAICLVDGRESPAVIHAALDTTKVVFRHLSVDESANYLERERPFDCAGSFKAERLGITLFERIESCDPTALIGLPLIALCRLLREAGIAPI